MKLQDAVCYHEWVMVNQEGDKAQYLCRKCKDVGLEVRSEGGDPYRAITLQLGKNEFYNWSLFQAEKIFGKGDSIHPALVDVEPAEVAAYLCYDWPFQSYRAAEVGQEFEDYIATKAGWKPAVHVVGSSRAQARVKLAEVLYDLFQVKNQGKVVQTWRGRPEGHLPPHYHEMVVGDCFVLTSTVGSRKYTALLAANGRLLGFQERLWLNSNMSVFSFLPPLEELHQLWRRSGYAELPSPHHIDRCCLAVK